MGPFPLNFILMAIDPETSSGWREKDNLFNGLKFTGLDTRSATDALFQVNGGRCFFLPSDCFRWACLLTEAAHLTFF